MSEFKDLVEIITKQIEIGSKVFVYYEKESGRIVRISNKIVNDLMSVEHMLAPRQDVMQVMNGFKRLEDYVVSYDPILKDLKVVEKQDDIKNLSINDRLHEIKSTRGTTYDIKITQDMQEGEWIISLHTKIEHLLKKTGFNQTRILLFTITKKNDPNVLYRRIELNLLDLVYNGAIKIPYEHNWEREMSTVSIYTNKYFDDYKYEIKL